MIEYLIIQLDDTSTSFCHYVNPVISKKLIPLNTLKDGIFFAMKENLMIQFIYPDYELSSDYKETIESIDHSKIISSLCEDEDAQNEADVIVFHGWSLTTYEKFKEDKSYVLLTSKADLFERYQLLSDVLSRVDRFNVVITDIETFTMSDFEEYKIVLQYLSQHIEKLFVNSKPTQLNLLTDRMMLSKMNNCGAGDTNITLAPNGKFYVCPAFYFENEADNIGDLKHGLNIKNKKLFRLDYAPICRHCDAWQCKRCIWLNRKTTLEVNTPSHEQCVVSHLERNASRGLLNNIRKHGIFLPNQEEINEIDYLDPFDERDTWQ